MISITNLLVLSFGLGFAAKYGLKAIYQRLEKPKEHNSNKSTVIFITPKNRNCKMHILKKLTCGSSCSYKHFQTILNLITSAKHSVSMCACLLTAQEIQDAIVYAKSKGLVVRLISDSEMLKHKASRPHYLKQHGISIKTPENNCTTMHNKFLLVDEHFPDTARLIVGSLNLTCQALTLNWETIIITDDMKIIQEYSRGYECMWRLLKEY